jgi:pimeloyl-ACP methyl ester carboxylesterase
MAAIGRLMRERFVQLRSLEFCLCEWGEPGAPLVLCLHGFLDQGAAWSLVAERYHFIAPDARGHGRSSHAPPGSDYHFPDYLSDLDALVEHLAPGRLHLVGHSMGGTVASLYAGLRPDKVDRLALVEGFGPPAEKAEDLPTKLRLHLDQLRNLKPHRVMKNPAAAAERLRRMTPALSEAFALFLAERSTEPVSGGVRWRWDRLHRTRMPAVFSAPGYQATLAQINAPTTAIFGDQSWYRFPDLDDRVASIATLSRHTIPGNHSLHIDSPKALADCLVNAFRAAAE